MATLFLDNSTSSSCILSSLHADERSDCASILCCDDAGRTWKYGEAIKFLNFGMMLIPCRYRYPATSWLFFKAPLTLGGLRH